MAGHDDEIEASINRQAGGIRGAGFIEQPGQRLTLRVEGQIRSADELCEAVIMASAGTPVRLRDVAVVTEAPEPKVGDASVNGTPGVLIVVSKQYEGDSYEITRRVEAEIYAYETGLVTPRS